MLKDADIVIDFNSSQYNQVRDFYSKSGKEQLAILEAKRVDSQVFPTKFDIYDTNMISSASKKHMEYDAKDLVTRIVFAKYSGSNVIVGLHTHPGFLGTAVMSDADKQGLARFQQIADKVNVLYLVGISATNGINFFSWNKETGEAERVPYKVDGIIMEDPNKKTPIESFKDGFETGRRRTGK
jgi:proteasome lid subunit RPN8/RPN11